MDGFEGWVEGGAKSKMGEDDETNHSVEERRSQDGRSPMEEETD